MRRSSSPLLAVLAYCALLLSPSYGFAAKGPWKQLPPRPTKGFGFAPIGVVANGLFYVIGGNWGPDCTRAVEVFDPKTSRWTHRAPMPTARTQFAGGVIGGRIYAAGGWIGSAHVGTLEVYDPATDTWQAKATMPTARDAQGAVLDGKLYTVGGSAQGHCMSDVESYDPATDTWTRKAALRAPRCRPAVVALNGRIYAIGGADNAGEGRAGRAIEIYDPATDSWSAGPTMPTGRQLPAVAAVSGLIYAIGGGLDNGAFSGAVEVYDPRTGEWSTGTPLPTPRYGPVAGVINGTIYVAGGQTSQGWANHLLTPGDVLEAYDPRLDKLRRLEGPSAAELSILEQRLPRMPPSPARPPAPPTTSDVDGFSGGAKPHPDDFALIVGIDNYRSVLAANYGERDAETFRRYAQTVLGVPEENIIFLAGQKATRTDFTKYIEEWLPRNVEKNSRVYFYYSGHGAPDPSKGTPYLVPWDGDPEFLESSAYPVPRLYEKLNALKAKEVVVLLDSCFSGQGGRSVIAKNLRPLVNVVEPPRPKGNKLSILTASSGDEVAGALDERGHGIFTYYLLKGLQGEADADHNGHLDLDELYTYMSRGVLRAAHRQNREQHPKLETSKVDLRVY